LLEDSSSIYTGTSSIAFEARKGHVEALAAELFELVRRDNMASASEKHVFEALPQLLKNFALSIGYNAPNQMHRDVMVFIQKYRR
jgi:hypothetical protein